MLTGGTVIFLVIVRKHEESRRRTNGLRKQLQRQFCAESLTEVRFTVQHPNADALCLHRLRAAQGVDQETCLCLLVWLFVVLGFFFFF